MKQMMPAAAINAGDWASAEIGHTPRAAAGQPEAPPAPAKPGTEPDTRPASPPLPEPAQPPCPHPGTSCPVKK